MVSILRLGKYNGQVSAKYHILCFMSPNKIASKFWNSLLAPSRKRVQLSETCMTCMFLAPIRKIFNHNFGSNNFVIPKYVLTFELQIRELLAFNYQCFSMPKHLRIQKSIQFQKLFWPFTVWINCSKGQLISKCLFSVFNSPKKRTRKFGPSFLWQTFLEE